MIQEENGSNHQIVSLRSIASEMGVGVATVSRAISGDRGVSKQLSLKIREFARLKGYQPQPLRRNVKKAIGVMMYTPFAGRVDDKYQEEVIYHVERSVYSLKKHVHVEFLNREAESSVWPTFLTENRVDGVVVSGHPPVSVCERLRQEGIPTVCISDTLERTGCSSVLPDPTRATREIVQKLVQLGHRHIGLVLTDRQFPTIELRYKAYYFAMFDAGIKPAPSWLIDGVEANVRGGREAVMRYIENKDLPSAIIFIDDRLAVGGMVELLRRGYRIPEQVSLVGYDNNSISEEIDPGLCTVDMGMEKIVSIAVDLLEKQISGELSSPTERRIEGQLIWRQSCTKFQK